MTTENTRLTAGSPAPEFSLPDQNNSLVSLSDFAGKKVILYFYPAAMTPGCTTQACDFRDQLSSLQSEGYVVVGISRDTPEKLTEFRRLESLTFALLSDPDHRVHEAYGAWGEKNLYGKQVVGVIRSTFVIGEDGAIVLPMYAVKATGHVASLRKKLGLG
ncbi:MAG: thioredoxin-dependent thiol peroxidase [Rhodoglobus sp.]